MQVLLGIIVRAKAMKNSWIRQNVLFLLSFPVQLIMLELKISKTVILCMRQSCVLTRILTSWAE